MNREKKTTQAKQQAPREKVILKKDHRHGGDDYQSGDDIMVTPSQKEWLKKNEVI